MKILITGAWQCTSQDMEKIETLGHSLVFMQYENEALPCDPAEIEGVICNGLFLHHDIKKFKNLKYIQLTSAGFDRTPLNEIIERKITIHNARGVYSIPMAEFAISGVLDLYKKSGFFHESQKERKWEKHRGLKELYENTVCIVGCGSVGNECAKRFSAFGCSVLGIDLYPREDALYEEMLGLDRLKETVARADVVILTLPLTEQTHHLFDNELFSAMKDGSVLVNIARGGIVDSVALRQALNGKLFGAVLDVFEQEPLDAGSPLWTAENVIVTPHNSFVGNGNKNRLLDLIVKNLEDYDEDNCSCT